MSDKSLTPDAAAEIDSYTQQSIAKINDNANALFSRIIAANAEALSATKGLEKLGKDSSRRFDDASTSAAKMKAEVRKLEERIQGSQSSIEEFQGSINDLLSDLSTDALKTMLASEMHRQVATFYANSLKPISLDTSGPQPCKNLVYPGVQKDSMIDALLEMSGHGTEREDIVRAFEAGVKFASPDVTFFGPETDFDD